MFFFNQVISHMKSDSTLLTHLLYHVRQTFVCDFFIDSISSSVTRIQFLGWLKSCQFCSHVISRFGSKFSELHPNLSLLLISMMDNLSWDEPLLTELRSENSMSELMKFMKEKGNNSGFTYGLLVMIRIVNGLFNSFKKVPKDKIKNMPFEDLPPVVRLLCKEVTLFMKLLKAHSPKKVVSLEKGTKEAVGMERLVLVRSVEALAELGYSSLYSFLLESNFYQTLLEILSRFPYNTFFHRSLCRTFSLTVDHLNQQEIILFLKKVQIVEFLLLSEEKDKKFQQKRGQRVLQYIPYLHTIAWSIIKQSEKYSEVKEHLHGNQGWTDYETQVNHDHSQQKSNDVAASKMRKMSQKLEGEDDVDTILPPTSTTTVGTEDSGILVEEDCLTDDVDLDSGNDGLDYQLETNFIIVSKMEIERFSTMFV
eukprot:TRINITY_DN14162_c0_g2_i11.p1 TRINITY_DN14162_c0_g2~~TRINITY_DN14162_c0_g2_i11.p1  ORF type:complete len:423 (-),score=107.90 TRINITY_DN14162_c0_g2_i11:120-1388(-)